MESGIDQAFVRCLAEIEKSYLALPKPLRIRVERWIEKLATSGNNRVFKKHRNAYAKLLLNMVLAQNLEDPFNKFPPEGSLAPFPAHLKASNRNLLGPHESSFWRDLYGQVSNTKSNGSPLDNTTSETEFKHLLEYSKASDGAQSRIASAIQNQEPLSREIQNLNMLIKEQSQQIKLLEQQLHDERAKHELQIQRLHYSNRMEVNRLKTEIDNFAQELSVMELDPMRYKHASKIEEGFESSVYMPSSSPRAATAQPAAERGTNTTTMERAPKTTAVVDSVAPVDSHVCTSTKGSASIPSFPIRLSASFESADLQYTGAGADSPLAADQGGNDALMSSPTPTGTSATNAAGNGSNNSKTSSSSSSSKRGLLSFLDQKHQITTHLNATTTRTPVKASSSSSHSNSHSRDLQIGSRNDVSSVFDLTPQRSSGSLMGGNSQNNGHVGMQQSVDAGREDTHNTGSYVGHWHPAVSNEEDKEFLAYIEQFQSEIKKVNDNITITSPQRY
mmetsp:Transcript_32788/g.55282  ORF Transcript_32788/g.55282 Transcript_32788/m.55282 type:complete len:503 (-) Transcript_32788:92-1600(-)